MDFNFIIIPVVIITTAAVGTRYVKRGLKPWYEELHKPAWTPTGGLIGEIWTFLYIVTGLAILWYWNVPVVHWLHYATATVLVINAYLNATWNKVFFVEHNLTKALQRINLMILTTVLAIILMTIDSLIAAGLMLPYLVWLVIARNLNKRILEINSK